MPDSQIESRRHALSAGLAGRKLDALLVSFGANLRYLSGFTGSNAALLLLPGDAILFTDPRYAIQAARETSCSVRIVTGPLLAAVAAALAASRARHAGYEPGQMTCEAFRTLEAHLPPRVSMVPAGGWVEQSRMIKSAEEIETIRRSVDVNSRAFDQAVTRAKPGVKERDLAAELEYRMRQMGAEKPSFETIVAVGVRSALPHASPTAARLAAGNLVLVDMGAMVDGYASDMTRMLHVGAPGTKAKRMYRAVLEAQLAAVDAVRPGVSAGHVDRTARRVLRGHGLEKAFVHSTGHGLGLEIHERPRIGRHEPTRLAEGMTITIEPGAYVEGFGGIRIEDTVVVTARGCEVLTPTSKELREV